MNLSITPVNFNNYSAAQNSKNQSQNFGAIQARVFRHPEDGKDILYAFRKRDMVVDKFLVKFAFSSKMSAMLKNKSQNFVPGKDRLPIMVDLKRGNELSQAEELAYVIQGANLDKIS